MIPAIITVRTKSTRLPNKCLLPFGAGTVLDHMINRVRNYGMRPILSTTEEPEDDVIERIAIAHRCEIYRGDPEDKMKRWLGTCERYKLDDFYTADADDLFFDGELAKEGYGLRTKTRSDIVYPIYPAPYVGHMGFSLSTVALRRACKINSGNTEMIWKFFEKLKCIRAIKTPECYANPYRLTLDYEEDYTLLKIVLEECGWKADKAEILRFFLRNPLVYKTNWFRNEEWKRGQGEDKGD